MIIYITLSLEKGNYKVIKSSVNGRAMPFNSLESIVK